MEKLQKEGKEGLERELASRGISSFPRFTVLPQKIGMMGVSAESVDEEIKKGRHVNERKGELERGKRGRRFGIGGIKGVSSSSSHRGP